MLLARVAAVFIARSGGICRFDWGSADRIAPRRSLTIIVTPSIRSRRSSNRTGSFDGGRRSENNTNVKWTRSGTRCEPVGFAPAADRSGGAVR